MRRAAFLAAALAAATPGAAAPGEPVALELVLAVDVSSSVDSGEFALQMRGLAEAFRHPAVHAAIRAVGAGGVAVAVLQWSDADEQSLVVDWTRVEDADDALALARRIRDTPRLVAGGQTALGEAIRFALDALDGNRFAGRRRVIDVSGDGRANAGEAPARARDRAASEGVTVNGLAILNEEPFLDAYYRYAVIGGNGAFLLTAADYEDFAVSVLRKLIREIAPPLSRRPGRGRNIAVAGGRRAAPPER